MFGGLASKASGGSFANGAVSAAFTHLFNHESSRQEEGYDDPEYFDPREISEEGPTWDNFVEFNKEYTPWFVGAGAGGVVLNAYRLPKYIYHFTSAANYEAIMASGVINVSRGLYGTGVYTTRWNSRILAAFQGAKSTQAVIRIPAKGFVRTPFPGTFRSSKAVGVR